MANRKVRWINRALKQLNKILDYIEADSPKNAKKVADGISKAITKLINNPEHYPIDKWKKNNNGSYRAFELHNYRISYRLKSNEILVLRIRHTSMKPKEY